MNGDIWKDFDEEDVDACIKLMGDIENYTKQLEKQNLPGKEASAVLWMIARSRFLEKRILSLEQKLCN